MTLWCELFEEFGAATLKELCLPLFASLGSSDFSTKLYLLCAEVIDTMWVRLLLLSC